MSDEKDEKGTPGGAPPAGGDDEFRKKMAAGTEEPIKGDEGATQPPNADAPSSDADDQVMTDFLEEGADGNDVETGFEIIEPIGPADEAEPEEITIPDEPTLEQDAQSEGPPRGEEGRTSVEDDGPVVPADDDDKEKPHGTRSPWTRLMSNKNFNDAVGIALVVVFLLFTYWVVSSPDDKNPTAINERQTSVEEVASATDDVDESSTLNTENILEGFFWKEFETGYTCEEKYSVFLALQEPHCDVLTEAVYAFENDVCAPVRAGTKRAKHFEQTCPNSEAIAVVFPPPPPPEPEPEAQPKEEESEQIIVSRADDSERLARIDEGVQETNDRLSRLEKRVETLESYHEGGEVFDPNDPCPPSLGKMRDSCYADYEENQARKAEQREREEKERKAAEAERERREEERKAAAATAAQRERDRLAAEQREREEKERKAAEAEREREQLAEATPVPETPETYAGHQMVSAEEVQRILKIRPAPRAGWCLVDLAISKQGFVSQLSVGTSTTRNQSVVGLRQNQLHKNFKVPIPNGSSTLGQYKLVRVTLDSGEYLERLFRYEGKNLLVTMEFDSQCGVHTP